MPGMDDRFLACGVVSCEPDQPTNDGGWGSQVEAIPLNPHNIPRHEGNDAVVWLVIANALLIVFAWQWVRGAWYKTGVNYLLDNQQGTAHGASNLFVALCLNMLLWVSSIAFWWLWS
jgi:hypothetical protein